MIGNKRSGSLFLFGITASKKLLQRTRPYDNIILRYVLSRVTTLNGVDGGLPRIFLFSFSYKLKRRLTLHVAAFNFLLLFLSLCGILCLKRDARNYGGKLRACLSSAANA